MRKISLKKILLILVLIIASALRFVGTTPGYPPYHSDEGISYSSAVEMIRNSNLDPLRYDYPAATPMTNYLFFRTIFMPLSWTNFYISNIGNILEGMVKIPLDENTFRRVFQHDILGERELYALTWGRYVTAFLGVGVVFLTYIISKNTYGSRVGIIAAFFVAVNYRQVLNSHLGLPDIYNAFFLLLAFFASLKLLENPTRKNYLFAGITAGLSFATKYQFFSFFPLLLVNLYLFLKHKKININMFLIPTAILFVFLLINPYMFIKIEKTIEWTTSVAGKYRVGVNRLDFYPLSYLYHIGLGKIISLLVILGVFTSLTINWRKSLMLLSVVFPFFYITVFYTGGGFYTRNFVTITPFLLILAAVNFELILRILGRFKYLGLIMVSMVAVFVSFENIKNSIVVPIEYSKPWNYQVLEGWMKNNFKSDTKVAAHSSVPLSTSITRLPYDFDPAFSIDEFRESGADYAIANLDWATGDFYGWMTSYSLKHWNKPVDELNRSYAALTLKELANFSVYSVINPWQAPESNFIVAKIPEYKVNKKEIMFTYENINNGWKSEVIDIKGWKGLHLNFDMTANFVGGDKRDGYVYVKFYKTIEDAKADVNEITVRLSDRSKLPGKKIMNDLSGVVPEEATHIVVGADVYVKEQNSLKIEKLEISKADIEIDMDNAKVEKLKLDENIIFPNSHGYL